MTGTLLNRRARAMASVWREYWSSCWGKLPDWPSPRLAPLLSATLGRRQIKERKRVLARPPIVQDYPDGKAPFLGVVTLGSDGKISSDSGVLQFPLKGHLLTVAPTRTGKGACHIVPNLLLYGGSCLVVDVKGENYALTAARRREMFPGARVLRFAPLEEDSARYNPLDFIRTELNGASLSVTYDDARLVSEMLLPSKPGEEFWDIEARNLLTLLIMYVSVRFERHSSMRSMRTVMALLFPTNTTIESGGHGLEGVLNQIIEDSKALREPTVQSLASAFIEHEGKVFAGIVSTCRASMHIWHSPNLQKATEQSDFLFSDLKSIMCKPLKYNPAPLTIYLVIPPQYLKEYNGVLRMMVGLAVAELTRDPEWGAFPNWRASPPCDVLFLLDELSSLGYMGPIVDGLAYLAGYGVKLWSFLQNLGQLKEVYGEAWHNFVANAGAMSFFGINDPDTAEYVTKLLGNTAEYASTYVTESTTSSWSSTLGENSYSSTDGESTTTNLNVRFQRVEIASAADIRGLDSDLQFVFIRNTPPILATKMPYYDFRGFKGLYGAWGGTGA